MFILIKNYVSKMTINDIKNYALKNNINLSENESIFVYNFIKKNYEALYANPNIDLSRFKNNFSEENYQKITKLIKELKIKYAQYL